MSKHQHYLRYCLYGISASLLSFSLFFGVALVSRGWTSPLVELVFPFVEILWWGWFGISHLIYSIITISEEMDSHFVVEATAGTLALFIKLLLFHLIAESMLWVLAGFKRTKQD